MGGFLVPTGDGSGDVVHGLDSLHNSDGNSSREIGDEGGSVFDFIILSVNNAQLKLVDIFLELFSSGNAGGGKPVHGFLLNVGIPESFLEISFKDSKSPKRLVGKSLLVADFSPHGSRPFLHIRQGIGNLPVVIMVEGMVDK